MKSTLDILLSFEPVEDLGEILAWAIANPDPKLAWETCPEPKHLLWIAWNLKVDEKLFMLTACKCARAVLHFIPEGENLSRSRNAIETTEAFLRGEATTKDLASRWYANKDAALTAAGIADSANAVYERAIDAGNDAIAALADTTADAGYATCAALSTCDAGSTIIHSAVLATYTSMDSAVIADVIRSVLTWDVIYQHIPKE